MTADRRPMDWAREGWVILAVAVLLAVHAGLGWDAARRLTVTHDEYWHLPVGLLNATTGRFDYDPLNPSLTRLWPAVPLVAMGAKPGPAAIPKEIEAYGDAFLEANGPRHRDLLTAGRVANLFWSILGGAVLALWARELYGRLAAIAAAILWACCPTLLAHASLVTPDVGLTAWWVTSLYALWRFARGTGWMWALLWGVSLGLALAAKFTAVLLVPLAPAMWLAVRFRANVPNMTLRDLALKWGAAAGVALVVVNGLHLFEGSFQSLSRYAFASKSLSSINGWPAWLRALPVPLPRPYVTGLDQQRFIMEQKHPSYLDGKWSETGFRDYYVRALAYKLPHAFQILLLLACWTVTRTQSQELRGATLRLWIYLAIPGASLLVVSSVSGMQLGVRYVMPVLPLFMLAATAAVADLDFARSRWRSGLVCLMLAALPLSLRHHPQHLGYFNELAGGPAGGREHLLDSNIDWGQNLIELKEYIDAHRLKDVKLAYFGAAPPARFGFAGFQPPPAFIPQPGWYAVSVNFVKWRPHFVRMADGRKRGLEWDKNSGAFELGYFHDFKPVTTIGTSIDVYHLTQGDVARWHSVRRRRP